MSLRYKQLLIAILMIATLLRILSAVYLGNQVVALPGTADQISYHSLALRVLDGHGFTFDQPWWPATEAGAPTAHWSYLYTIYLVVIYAIFGPNPLAARVIQAIIIGTAQTFLAYIIAKRTFNKTIGLAAAGVTAIYLYFIYYAGTLMTEPFFIIALMGSLYLGILITSNIRGNKDTTSRIKYYYIAIALGITLGIAVLLRQLFILFIPFLYLWIFYATRKYPLRYTRNTILISGFIILAMILPITVYNYLRFGQFVLLNTNAGYALFWANHPIHGTHFIPILPSGTYQALIPSELTNLDEAALDKALLVRGLKFIFDDPVRYLMLSISRIPAYFKFWPSGESSAVSNLTRVASFGIFLPFMIYGLVRSFTLRRNEFINDMLSSPTFLLYIFIIVYTGIHLLSWALIRYRLPLDAVLLIFAGFALVDIANRIMSYFSHTRKLKSVPD